MQYLYDQQTGQSAPSYQSGPQRAMRQAHVPAAAFGPPPSSGPTSQQMAQMPSRLMAMGKEHFQTKETLNGTMLITPQISSPTFILFYTTTCGVCKQVLPLYDQLAKLMPYRFAICNVQQNPDILQMSEQTIRPIRHVPLLFLYAKGYPYVVYSDTWAPEKLQNFLRTTWEKAQQQMGGSATAAQASTFAPASAPSGARPRIQAQQYPVADQRSQPSFSSPHFTVQQSQTLTCEGDECGELIPFNQVICNNSHGCYVESNIPVEQG